MVLYDWFDNTYFNTRYLNGSKYQYKEDLLAGFYQAYANIANGDLKGSRLNWVRDNLRDPGVKKNMRRLLTDWGYSKTAIDGIFRVCNACIKDQLS